MGKSDLIVAAAFFSMGGLPESERPKDKVTAVRLTDEEMDQIMGIDDARQSKKMSFEDMALSDFDFSGFMSASTKTNQ